MFYGRAQLFHAKTESPTFWSDSILLILILTIPLHLNNHVRKAAKRRITFTPHLDHLLQYL